jgi:hypothetical protein
MRSETALIASRKNFFKGDFAGALSECAKTLHRLLYPLRIDLDFAVRFGDDARDRLSVARIAFSELL